MEKPRSPNLILVRGRTMFRLFAERSGVPKGSVLGPILFIFYINNVTDVMPAPSTSKLYADDLKAHCCETVETGGKCFQETLANQYYPMGGDLATANFY